MRPLRLGGALAALLLLVAAPAAAPAAPAPIERQILVFLRLTPQHYRPSSSYGGGYGDAEDRAGRLRVAGRLAQRYGVSLVSEWPMPLLGVHCLVMTVAADQSPQEVAARVSKDPSVSWSEPMQLYRAQESAPRASSQAAPGSYDDPLYRVQPAAAEWRLAELHRVATGRNVKVAVIDSLVEKAHPDLAGQVEVSVDFVAGRPAAPERHGTGVAGVIAARPGNGVGIAGVAPRARLMALRACWQEGRWPGETPTLCDSLSLARALDYAIAKGAQVINLSLSGPQDILLSKLLDIAVARGVVVVAAVDLSVRGGGFPASHPGVVAVAEEGAAPLRGVLAAPGLDVPTTQPGGTWALVSGASYAAAHVSGLAALLRERTPLRHSPPAPLIVRAGDKIDACATLLQKPGPCACGCAGARELLTAAPR